MRYTNLPRLDRFHPAFCLRKRLLGVYSCRSVVCVINALRTAGQWLAKYPSLKSSEPISSAVVNPKPIGQIMRIAVAEP